MNTEQLKAARIIRRHYGLTRPVTLAEVRAEVTSLQRKSRAGSMCDIAERLHSALQVAGVMP